MSNYMQWEKSRDEFNRPVWRAEAPDGAKWAILETVTGHVLSIDGCPVDSGRNANGRFAKWSDAARCAEGMNEARA